MTRKDMMMTCVDFIGQDPVNVVQGLADACRAFAVTAGRMGEDGPDDYRRATSDAALAMRDAADALEAMNLASQRAAEAMPKNKRKKH